jgi:transposase-like protein
MSVGQAGGGQPGGPRAGQPKRRTFSIDYKLAMVEAYDTAAEPGAKGALLRREGLYDSHISSWRTARNAGRLGAVSSGRPAAGKPERPAAELENERLRKKVARLEATVERQDAALVIVKKAHALLEMLSESADSRMPSGR